MMTQGQKRNLEIPLFLLIFWLVQALELFVFRIPWIHGGIQLAPILIIYLSMTRGWKTLAIFGTTFAFMGSFNVGYPAALFIAAQLWTAFFVKIMVQEFALEGRRSFAFLNLAACVFSKTLIWFFLAESGKALPLSKAFINIPITSIFAFIAAWLVYPLLLWWEELFDHPSHENTDLNKALKGRL
jgi:hypothetical protein